MTYDPVGKRVLLFGGYDQKSALRNDLWAWNGKAWSKLAEGGPAPRTHVRMAFDENAGVLILFGGSRGGRNAFGDTWMWNGQSWREVAASGPAKRGSHVMAYDRAAKRIVMYGGSNFDGTAVQAYADTWAWTGQRWVEVAAR
jgi:hypothetical protein